MQPHDKTSGRGRTKHGDDAIVHVHAVGAAIFGRNDYCQRRLPPCPASTSGAGRTFAQPGAVYVAIIRQRAQLFGLRIPRARPTLWHRLGVHVESDGSVLFLRPGFSLT